jgi:hypothetical protein
MRSGHSWVASREFSWVVLPLAAGPAVDHPSSNGGGDAVDAVDAGGDGDAVDAGGGGDAADAVDAGGGAVNAEDGYGYVTLQLRTSRQII